MAANRRHRLLDLGSALLLLAAVGVMAGERLVPAWRASRVLETGDRVPAELAVRTLAAGDTLPVAAAAPTLLLFYRSDCPACGRALPAWRRLVDRAGGRLRVLTVGLEEESAALAWVRAELPRALAVRPVEPARFLRRLGVRRVPTTVLVGSDDRLLHRRSGVPTPAGVRRLLALAGARAPVPRP